jgi:exosortase K
MKASLYPARATMIVLPFALVSILHESFKLSYFARPAAWLASFFSWAKSPVVHDDGYALACFGMDILVNSSCTGTNFFAIGFCAVFFVLSRDAISFKALLAKFAVAAALAYPLTILANAFRIFFACLGWRVASSVMPGNYFHAVHMCIGIVIFFLMLALFIYILTAYTNGREYRKLKPNSQ